MQGARVAYLQAKSCPEEKGIVCVRCQSVRAVAHEGQSHIPVWWSYHSGLSACSHTTIRGTSPRKINYSERCALIKHTPSRTCLTPI